MWVNVEVYSIVDSNIRLMGCIKNWPHTCFDISQICKLASRKQVTIMAHGIGRVFFLLEQHFEDSMCDGYLPCTCLVEFLLIVF